MASEDIVQLEFPRSVRDRYGMYIGSADNANVIFRESVDNSTDELYAGKPEDSLTDCDTVWISSNLDRYTVADNCRGIPTKESPQKKGWTMTRLAVSSLHAGSKFSGNSISQGTNGVGVSCLSPDSRILVCDSLNKFSEISIRELSENPELWNDYFLISVSDEGKLKKTKIEKVWKTKEVTRLIEFEFEDGSVIKCTEDHLFRLSDGSYRRADEITFDDDIEDLKPKFPLRSVLDKKVDFVSHCVYRIYNKHSNRSYIGSFIYSLSDRFVNHDWFGQSHKTKIVTGHTPLYESIREQGIDSFIVEILYSDPNIGQRELLIKEEEFVSKYDSFNNGYNTTKNGDWGSNPNAGVLGNIRKGTNRWNHDYQSQRSYEGIKKFVDLTLSKFPNPDLITESSWNLNRQGRCLTYQKLTRDFDRYCRNNVISEYYREYFSEDRIGR